MDKFIVTKQKGTVGMYECIDSVTLFTKKENGLSTGSKLVRIDKVDGFLTLEATDASRLARWEIPLENLQPEHSEIKPGLYVWKKGKGTYEMVKESNLGEAPFPAVWELICKASRSIKTVGVAHSSGYRAEDILYTTARHEAKLTVGHVTDLLKRDKSSFEIGVDSETGRCKIVVLRSKQDVTAERFGKRTYLFACMHVE